MEITKVEKFEFRVGGELVWKVAGSLGNMSCATATLRDSSAQENPVITEAVRRAVAEYGEVLQKLSNE